MSEREEPVVFVCAVEFWKQKRLKFLCQARDIYEEAIQTVITVRDFTQVFDACAQFEKSMIAAKMESMEEEGAAEEGKLCLLKILQV